MTNTTCFSRDELRSYLFGNMPEAATGAVALHVETCETCEATVAELDRESDTLIESLREPIVPDEPDAAYRLAAKRAISHLQSATLESDGEDFGEQTANAPRLRDYELIEPLARGGMGTVYRARHLRLNRQVALKVLPGRLLQNPGVVARFEREMQAVGSLRHPAIVQATDGGEADGVHYLVMELIDGCDGSALVQLLGPLPVADACEIVRQAAIGMAYVHQQGIVHRDLKPSNLMVTAAGEVKVLDLGLARIVGEQLAEDELTTVGQLMGTLDFMAPEQVENSHGVDERADIYSLGATLYKLLAGCAPHATEAGEPLLSKLRRIASDPPMPLPQRRPDLPAELCQLVERMLSHSADDRPASMEAVADALAAFSKSSGLAKRVQEAVVMREKCKPSERSSASLPSASPAALASNNGASHDARPTFGRRVLAWAAAALLMLATAMGVVITLQTTAGQLIIETSSPDVEVRVLKAGQPYRQLTLKQTAESLRLGAGEYEVEIVSDADGLEIENGRYTLKRGETWLARIVHREPPVNSKRAAADTVGGMTEMIYGSGAVGPTSQEPTYEGKTLAQWLALLRRERSAEQLHEACKALEKLATGDDTAEAVAAVLVAIRVHDSQANYQKEGGGTSMIWDAVRLLLASREQSAVVPALIEELDRRDEANVEFILQYLLTASDSVGAFVNEQLLASIERLAADDQSQLRIQALSVLQRFSSKEATTRRLVAALSDRDIGVRLFAAHKLVEMQSNAPLVVSTLRQGVGSGELRHRAEAAWLLGDLGIAAEPALPELTAIVQDEDEAISRAAAYPTPRSAFGGEFVVGFGDGMTSVKDAAIRALAEIGNESVVPLLIAEWERRELGDRSPNKATPAWNNATFPIVANTYNAEWVADAIEKLIGMRPVYVRRVEGEVMEWQVGSFVLGRAYDTAFSNLLEDSLLPHLADVATRLMPRAQQFEKDEARERIANTSSSTRAPRRGELELEVKLITLLATADDPSRVLHAMFARWKHYAAISSAKWEPSVQAAALDAYHQCAVQILRSTKDWQTALVPRLLQLADDGDWTAGVVLTDVLPELDTPQQVDGIVYTLQLIAVSGPGEFTEFIEFANTWLKDASHHAAIQSRLDQTSSDAWEDLVIGILRTRLADDDVMPMLNTRFGDDSIDRRDMLKKLIRSLYYRSDLTQVIIDLLEHPALDAPATVMVRGNERTEISLRAALYLKALTEVPAQHRPGFMPLLQKLVQSGKNGESDAARNVLDAWK